MKHKWLVVVVGLLAAGGIAAGVALSSGGDGDGRGGRLGDPTVIASSTAHGGIGSSTRVVPSVRVP